MKDLLTQNVGRFMTKKVVAVKRDEALKKVFEIMDKHGSLGLPVVDEDYKVVGIVTEGDLIAHVTTLEAPSAIPLLGSLIYLENPQPFNEALKKHCAETVGEIMVSEVICIKSSDSLRQAVDTMAKHHLKRLPVVDKDGRLEGMLTRKDIVHQLAQLDIV